MRLSRPPAVTSVGALSTFSLPGTIIWMSLRVIDLLLSPPGRVRVSRSTGTASWMPWYSRRMIIRVTDLTWLLIMGVTRLFSSMRLIRNRTCYSRMVIYLTPSPWKMLSSRFSRTSSSANYRVERQISGTKISIRVWEFLKRRQREVCICAPWRRQAPTTKNEKGRGQKRWVINHTSQPASSSSFCFFPL